MAYVYPDKNDMLTCQLIDTEYDTKYWSESEGLVLQQAMEEINLLKESCSKKNQKLNLLDLGCGMGRLFSVYAEKADRITAAEPDEGRWRVASIEAERVSARSEKEIRVFHGDAACLPAEETYNLIVSSHVLQHITSGMAADMMHTMADKLEQDGILILTTTYTSDTEDLFYLESWKDGRRHNEVTDKASFNRAFGGEAVLPVRMFTSQSILSMAEKENLDLIRMSRYHYQMHHSASEDIEANRAGKGDGARDIMYIFRKRQKIDIDANICYHFSFSIFDEEIGLRLDDEEELRSAIRKAYPTAVFDDDEAAKTEPFFNDLSVGQGFLHGGGLPFDCFRVLLKDYNLQFMLETHSSAGVRCREYEIDGTTVFMTVFPDSDTVQVFVCLSVRNAAEEDFVYFRHVQGNGAKLKNHDGRMLSIKDIFHEVSGSINRNITDVIETYLLEIKRFGNYDSVDDILINQPQLVYGLMTGDEGWKHVPSEMAAARLENRWGSRDFIRLISFGANSIFFNLSQSASAVDYRAARENFDHSFYGDMNPYFSMDSNVAGVNHGILFSMELVMVIKTISNRILRRQAAHYSGTHGGKLRKEISKLKRYRGELITTLNKVENLSISEIDEMERVLLNSQQIDPIIDKIKYLLELLESELDLLYNSSTNRLGTAIAIGGLIFAGIQILLAL